MGLWGQQEQDLANNCHIYVIGKTPIISYCKESFKYEAGVLSGKIIYRIEGVLRERGFSFEFPLLDSATEV